MNSSKEFWYTIKSLGGWSAKFYQGRTRRIVMHQMWVVIVGVDPEETHQLASRIRGFVVPGDPQRAVDVQVVETIGAARALFYTADVIIFMTDGMLVEANRMKEARPGVGVYVFSELIQAPQGMLVPQYWGRSEDLLFGLVMNGPNPALGPHLT